MSVLTESESAFELFCNVHGLPFERIESCDERRADYRLVTSVGAVICEIKQFQPNSEERAALRAMKDGRAIVVGATPGARVRNAISSALPQIKNLTRGELPGLVVVCDTAFFEHAGAYNIRVAMYGFDAIVFAVPKDHAITPFAKDRKSGGKRRMTEAHSTSISAVADLRYRHDGPPTLDVYHNRFAATPLVRKAISGEGIRHFRLREKAAGQFDDWEECS